VASTSKESFDGMNTNIGHRACFFSFFKFLPHSDFIFFLSAVQKVLWARIDTVIFFLKQLKGKDVSFIRSNKKLGMIIGVVKPLNGEGEIIRHGRMEFNFLVIFGNEYRVHLNCCLEHM
jgi:hypothetical protein